METKTSKTGTEEKNNRKPVVFTYAVKFKEDVWYKGNCFLGGEVYEFKARSESNHNGDLYDNAYAAIHDMLGCLKNDAGRSFKRFLKIDTIEIK